MTGYRKPHRFKRKNPVAKSRFFLSGFLIFVFFVIVFYFLFLSDFFQIQELVVSGNKKVLKEEIMILAENEFSKPKLFFPANNILLVNLRGVEESILHSFPQIAEVNIGRKLPRTLIFTIFERKGVAEFCKAFELFTKEEEQALYEKCFFLDREGIVFEEVLKDDLFLPKIKNPNSESQLWLGQKIIDKELLSGILDIFSQLKDLTIETKEFLIVSDERINIKTSDNWEIYFNPKEALDWQITKLRAVLNKDIPSERRDELGYIELRFGNLAPFKYREIEE